MKKILMVLFFSTSIFAQEQPDLTQTEVQTPDEKTNVIPTDINNSFITKYEYGKMLFNNPRGIGCNRCHGDDARGRKIVEFKHQTEGENKKVYNCSLVAPDIKEIEYDIFYNKVNSKKNEKIKFEKEQVCDKLIHNANVMPTYFLVEEEIESIYYYIRNLKK